MVLPLYVALEKIDPRLHRGRQGPVRRPDRQAFRRVTLPLALPGVFAGSLLTFIPAMGDCVNAELLGNTADQDDRQRHPEPASSSRATTRSAAALSFILMAGILVVGGDLRPSSSAPSS